MQIYIFCVRALFPVKAENGSGKSAFNLRPRDFKQLGFPGKKSSLMGRRDLDAVLINAIRYSYGSG